MAALAATSSATPSLQASLSRTRIEAARREADQAESYAKSLRAQAQDQERVMVQARERVQTLEKGASQPASNSANKKVSEDTTSAKASTPASPTAVTLEQKSTYTGLLADVFEAAKPILQSDLNSAQKNLVTSSLLDATNHAWTANQSTAKVQLAYGGQAGNPVSPPVGRVLNTSA
jgi:hypothetical protein